jgi:hypothetical protein
MAAVPVGKLRETGMSNWMTRSAVSFKSVIFQMPDARKTRLRITAAAALEAAFSRGLLSIGTLISWTVLIALDPLLGESVV